MPVPARPWLCDFHFHASVEHVIGVCAPLPEPVMLGATPAEAAWRLAALAEKALRECRRFLIPTIQALYANDLQTAEQLAVIPVTRAAELTRDALFTVLGQYSGMGTKPAGAENLCDIPACAGEHDSVYGGLIANGNKDVPPSNVPVTTGELLTAEGRRTVLPGFGMLPASGMTGPRDAWSSWKLPRGVFRRFCALAGLNAAIGRDGAVVLQVELDGKPVWKSGIMTAQTTAAAIEIELGRAEQLTLRVLDANDGRTFWHNHAYWGRPQLLRD